MEKQKKSKAWERTRAYKTLREGLFDNLAARGLIEPMYTDKVEEYLMLWVQLQQLKADIAENGVTQYDAKRGMTVENRSVSLEVQVSRHMLNIYAALGFKDMSSGKALAGDGEDDEL